MSRAVSGSRLRFRSERMCGASYVEVIICKVLGFLPNAGTWYILPRAEGLLLGLD